MKNKGLGRGLDAIFGLEGANIDIKSTPMSTMREIEVSKIIPNPTQPRATFDEEALTELADSIRVLGVIQPITVKRNTDNEYVIISGERRWRASKAAGLETIPAYIREVDDAKLHAMALVENIQRSDAGFACREGGKEAFDRCKLYASVETSIGGAVGIEGGSNLNGTRQGDCRRSRTEAVVIVEALPEKVALGTPDRRTCPRDVRRAEG